MNNETKNIKSANEKQSDEIKRTKLMKSILYNLKHLSVKELERVEAYIGRMW